MTKADVASLCTATWRFERVRLLWENRYSTNRTLQFSIVGENERKALDEYLNDFKAAIDNLDLNPVEDRLKKVALRCSSKDTTVGDMCFELQMLGEVTIDELKRHVFVHVPADKVNFYGDPEKFFSVSWDAYPSAQSNMRSACFCYAMGEDTAAVFHAMGVLQKGLEALAIHLKVSFPSRLDTQQWQAIIDKLQSEINEQTKAARQKPKSEARDEELKFYANTSLQFGYFKDAWRNDTAHFRQNYESDEARTVLTHVKNFMTALSQRVRETP
jgi:hypothetical protein